MRSENSGLIDLDALIKEASSGELPKSADDSLEAITTVPAAAESIPEPTPPPPPVAPAPTPTLPSVAPPAPKSTPTPTPTPAPKPKIEAYTPRPQPVPMPMRRKSRLPWFAVAIAVGAIAFLVGFRRPHEGPSVAPTVAATSLATTGSPSSPAPTTTIASGISLDSLPAAATASASASSTSIAVPAHAAAPIAAITSAKIVAIADAPQASAGDLGGAMREAVGPRASAEIANVDPTTNGSARQLRPSPGAVVGAINSVLPEARACLLTADDPPRGATIVFRSDGTVARVDLPGPARLNDECIRTALSKARTMPFVEDTFAARATVRP